MTRNSENAAQYRGPGGRSTWSHERLGPAALHRPALQRRSPGSTKAGALDGDRPSRCGKGAAPSDPAPLRLPAARPTAVDDGQRQSNHYEENGPAHNLGDQSHCATRASRGKHRRRGHNAADRKQDEQDHRNGEGERNEVELSKATFFRLVVDEVQRIKD
jgi:hypothetical protein